MATEVRVKNTVKNIYWILIFTAISSIFPFIIRTLIIRVFGMEYLGLNSLFASVLNVLNLGELGIGQALVISMYKPVAENDQKMINVLISLYSKVYKILGTIVLLIGIILIPFLPKFIGGDYPCDINILVLYFIYLTQSVGGYFAFAYAQAVFMGYQQISLLYKYHSLIWFVIYMLQILLILYVGNYYSYIIFLPIGTILCGIMDKICMQKNYPMCKASEFKRTDLTPQFWSDFIKRMVSMSISKIRTVIQNSFDVLVISIVLGVLAVAKYQNYIYVMAVPDLIAVSIITGIVPSLGNGMAVESKESNYAVTRIVAFVMNWIATVFSVFLIVFFQPFMCIYAGREGLLSDIEMYLFVLYFYIRIISKISLLIRNSSGIWWEGKSVPIIESVVNLVLNIILIDRLGIIGVLLATIISICVINIPGETYFVYKYCFQKRPWKDLMGYLYNMVISGVIVYCTYIVSLNLPDNGIMIFAIKILICIIMPNAMLFIVYYKDSRFKELWGIIKEVLIKMIKQNF